MSKFFLDTNILIDFFDSQRPNHKNAGILVKNILDNGNQIVISEGSINDLIYICRKMPNLDILIEAIESFTFDSSLVIASYGVQAIRSACGLYLKQKGDFEDYLQYFCAEKEECVAIYTSDKDFPKLRLPVLGYQS